MLAAAVDGGQTQAHSLSLVSGEGALDVQAQSDDVRVQSLKLISANADVALAAGKTLHLAVAGGASVTIEGGNITVACPGTITVHASKKSFVGPVEKSYKLPVPGATPYKLKYVLRDYTGEPLKSAEYAMYLADGSVVTGKTNAQGETEQVITDGPDSVHLMVSDERHEGYYKVSDGNA
ncbi:hypothetical protein LA05_10750 [Xanthomonas oryzae pv. oryzae]|nr:hypothetical protein LA05_10750 [Xanthomonas oryzae pv. oryzae]